MPLPTPTGIDDGLSSSIMKSDVPNRRNSGRAGGFGIGSWGKAEIARVSRYEWNYLNGFNAYQAAVDHTGMYLSVLQMQNYDF